MTEFFVIIYFAKTDENIEKSRAKGLPHEPHMAYEINKEPHLFRCGS